MSRPYCCNCKFWRDMPSTDGLGVCRRYPPTLLVVGGVSEVDGRCVETGESEWCGEYETRKEKL